MSEGFELVRTIRQHLRRGAALLEQGKLDEALAEANAVLALDAQSVPAQALRDRIQRAKSASTTVEPLRPVTANASPSSSYVPHGVNAASWRGFEQRISERRFRALLETVNTSIVAGDAAAARAALDEARELRPDAPELPAFEARVAAVPVTPISAESPSSARIWMRAMSAAALFLIGVSLFIGLELMRPASQSVTTAPVATTPPPPMATPGETPGPANVPETAPVAVPMDDDSIPAVIMPPEPTLRPRGTSGGSAPTVPASEPVARREAAPASVEPARPVERARLEEELPQPVAEIPDDYVANAAVRSDLPDVPRPAAELTPTTAPSTTDARPAAERLANERAATERTADARPAADRISDARTAEARPTEAARTSDLPRTSVPQTRVPIPAPAPESTAASAAVVPASVGPVDTSRVEEVLRRYARAYDALDASAARAVWPSVNEKALASAFNDLSSQSVSFENCDINVRGAVANASCIGQQSYVVKVGDREPRTEPRLWRFELRRDGDAWRIENAEMRRPTSSASYREQ
jgi:tetratricopeptide (TPR) repeat protein